MPKTLSPRRRKSLRPQSRRRDKTLAKALFRETGRPGKARRGAKGAEHVERPKTPGRHRQMRETSTQKIYDIQSKIYDNTFGRLVKKRIGKAIAEHVRLEAGQVVLDVGIGTGASLNFYPSDRGRIVGVDLSNGMLEKALDKIDETGRDNATIARANALELPFADDAFDTVFVSHVITVVSDPIKLLAECCRVGKPGAKIVMVNHFRSQNRVVALVEKLVCPICTKLGWRSDLALEELVEKTGMTIDYRYKLTTPDLWETVVVTNMKWLAPKGSSPSNAPALDAYEAPPAGVALA